MGPLRISLWWMHPCDDRDDAGDDLDHNEIPISARSAGFTNPIVIAVATMRRRESRGGTRAFIGVPTSPNSLIPSTLNLLSIYFDPANKIF
mmetsp:Transcript_26378/g.42611  ORF Transcript_26378/g.42611 Transcript_26378/m.42611 type:complete len:91 (-) Transcript_26378:67-339(-)